MEIQYSGRVERSDLDRGFVAVFGKKYVHSVVSGVLEIVSGLFFLGVMNLALKDQGGATWGFYLVAAVLILFGGITTRAAIKERKARKECSIEMSGAASASGIVCDVDGERVEHAWSEFKSVIKLKDFTVLVVDKRSFMVFPRRLFVQDTDWNVFNGFVSETTKSALPEKSAHNVRVFLVAMGIVGLVALLMLYIAIMEYFNPL